MHGFNDLIFESVRAIVLAGLIAFLVIRGRRSRFSTLPGAWLIIFGFSLILLGTLLDITNEIAGLDRFGVIGETPLEAFLEKIIGYTGGFLCILAGFVNILPAIAAFEKVEQNLRESEEKFRSAFETIPDVVGITRIRDGKVIDINPAFEELTGIPLADIIGRSSLEMNIWADPVDRERLVQGVLTNGMVRNLEASFNTGDGRLRDGLISARLLMLGGEAHFLSIYKDITESKQVVRSLEESEEKFRSIFETIPDVVSITRLRDGLVVDLSPTIMELTGRPREHFIGHSTIDMQAWANPADREHMVKEVLTHGSLRNMEAQLNTGSGTLRDCLVSARLMQLQGESHILAIFKDITERKRVQQALQQSEETYRTLFSSSPDPVWIIEKQRFVECNQAAVDILGYPDKNSLRNTHPSELSPEFQPDGEPSFSKAERMMLIAQGKGINRFEWVHRRMDQSDFFAEVTLAALTLQGRQVLYCTWRDITERKQIEERLRESESRFRLIFESSPDPFIIARADGGGILSVNRAFVAQTGLAAETAQGKSSIELGLWKDPLQREEFLRRVLTEGGVDNMEAEFCMKGGEIRSGLTSAKLVELGGERCILIDIRDITKQKQAESALLEMDRMKSEFISTAAHELRTPLAIILGYTELLRDPETFGGFSREQCDEFLEAVYHQGETLSRIIDEMLDISRIEGGHPIALAIAPHDPKTWLLKVIRRFELQGGRHDFRLELSGAQPESLLCDIHRITQVLENLLSNAVKYSPRGGNVTISAGIEGDDYVVAVADQGIGMTDEQVARVFDKFYRADSSNTAISGLGLGMSIARQIVENHGGRIWVESIVDKGTTASFTLPLTS